MKKIIVGILIVIAVGMVGVVGLLVWQQRQSVDDERVVYIRSLERQGFSYVATVDDVAASLETATVSDEPNTRVFLLEELPVSNLAVITLAGGKRLPVFGLASLLTSNPTYTNSVFTIGVKDGVITKATEESLE